MLVKSLVDLTWNDPPTTCQGCAGDTSLIHDQMVLGLSPNRPTKPCILNRVPTVQEMSEKWELCRKLKLFGKLGKVLEFCKMSLNFGYYNV